MASVNAVVHLFASIALIALIFFALRVQKQRDFLRSLLAPNLAKSVHVAWSIDFVKQLAAALGVDCVDETGRLKSRPHKIPLKVISAFVLNHQIMAIRLTKDQRQNCVIEIKTRHSDESSPEEWSQQLSKALNHKVFLIPS